MAHLLRARPPRWRHRFLHACVLAAGFAGGVLDFHGPAFAATGSLGVTAHVRAWTRVETTAAPTLLVVTTADVDRGWLEVSEPVVLTVRSNAQRGPALVVWTGDNIVRQGVLTGFSDPVRLGPGQATIQLPAQRPTEQVQYQLKVRLELAPGAQAGEYAFPLRFLSADGMAVSSAAP